MSASDTPTRLYVDIPANALNNLEATGQLLDRLAARLDIACIKMPIEKPDNDKSGDAGADNARTFGPDPELKGFIGAMQQKNIAVLAELNAPRFAENRKNFEKALEKAVETGFDGIHMDAEPELYERAREVLARDAIIGCACGTSRHQAMLMGEAGADYITLDPVLANTENADESVSMVELIGWWQELFEVPCVAAGVVDQSHLEALLAIGADFISIGPLFWPMLQGDEKFLARLAKKCPALAKVG